MKQSTNCARCGRPLHLAISRARGYGLTCWRRHMPQREFWTGAELERLQGRMGHEPITQR